MPLYINGTIKLIARKEIKGKDSTEDTVYFENYIQYQDKKGNQQVGVFNSGPKADFREFENKAGIATLTAYPTKALVEAKGTRELKSASLYKLSLSDFTVEE